MKKFNINNFIYHTLPNQNIIIQTNQSILQISEPIIISFLIKVDELSLSIIDYTTLEKYFNDETDEIISFLLEYNIIETPKKLNYKIKRILFYSNDEIINSILSLSNSNVKDGLSLELIDDLDLIKKSLSKDDLLITYFKSYNSRTMRELLNLVTEKECMLLNSYSYGDSIFIDNLFKKEWGVPCHFCNISLIKDNLRSTQDEELSYQNFVDSILQKDNNFEIEKLLNTNQVFFLLNNLLRTIDRHIIRYNNKSLTSEESMADVLNVIRLDLERNSVTKDTAIHWELCDCYE